MKIKQKVMQYSATEGNISLRFERGGNGTQYIINASGQYKDGKYTSYVSTNGTNLEEIKSSLSALLTLIAQVEELEVD